MKQEVMDTFDPVVIIGAPRSGTNLLRDVLVSIDGVCTWPCDEINAIWRYRNSDYPSDALPPQRADGRIRTYINSQFSWVATKYGQRIVVEKTCANSLRVPYVETILREPKYIFIARNGFDVVASAKMRWTDKRLNVRYLLKKARFVPFRECPVYIGNFISRRLTLGREHKRSGRIWGPVWDDLHAIYSNCSVNELCAYQWRACVESAVDDLEKIDPKRRISIRYEDFVNEPREHLSRILNFIGQSSDAEVLELATSNVVRYSVGKGKQMPQVEIEKVAGIIQPAQNRLDEMFSTRKLDVC